MLKIILRNHGLPCLLLSAMLLKAPLLLSAEASDQSIRLSQEAIIVDTHIDVPYRLHRNMEDISQASEKGQFDLPRAQAGGLDVIFMSIYTPASYETEKDNGSSGKHADSLIDMTNKIAKENPSSIAMASCVKDIHHNKEKGLISFAMGMENGSPLEGELARIDTYRIKGIRYITLAHSKSNHISDSSYDENEHWNGLSPFGKKVVKRMNARGIMIDISHLSDKAAWQVLKLSKAPVIASHSSLREFVPGFHRNMTDEMLKSLAENGGVLQINFGSGFVTAEAREWQNNRSEAVKAYMEEKGLARDTPEVKAFISNYAVDNPYPFASLDDVLDHFDHAVKVAGIDYVGIGSDYDGVGDTLPEGLKDVSTYPNLIQGLIDRGYTEEEIKKILGGNLLRVWKVVEDHAARQGYPPLCSQS